MDAPRRFFDRSLAIDYQELQKCVGPARIVDLGEVTPRAFIAIVDLGPLANEIGPGDHLLFITGWRKRIDTLTYRDDSPRIGLEVEDGDGIPVRATEGDLAELP